MGVQFPPTAQTNTFFILMQNLQKKPRCLLVEVITPHAHREEALDNLKELESLVATFGGEVVDRVLQHRSHPHKATYIGPGKVEELKALIKELKVNIVILNAIGNSGQLFRLEREFWPVNRLIRVWDRVDLILHIFEKHATSTEAQAQIELAQIQHMGPRIYGLGGTFFSRQAGGIGGRGAGETNIELMKRQLKNRTQKIRRHIEKMENSNKKHIDERKAQGVFTISLVGYTNSGKTTLFNQLTGKDNLAKDILFATLDSSLGKLLHQGKASQILISDTIGFIRDLPPSLLDTFKSTLMETVYADLILHVVDISDPLMREKMAVVDRILQDLKVDSKKIQLVFNKIDKLKNDNREKIEKRYLTEEPLLISAQSGEGIDELITLLKSHG